MYEKTGGYQSMRKAMRKAPPDISTIVTDSGLRGRGGASRDVGRGDAGCVASPEPYSASALHPFSTRAPGGWPGGSSRA